MSNRFLVKLAAVIAVGTASLLGATAHATAVSATASFTDMTLSLLTASNHQYLTDASTPFESAFDAGGVLTPFTFNTSTADGVSYAQVDDVFAPLPGTSAAATTDGEGHATVLWSLDWTALDNGTATISLEYLFNATIANLFSGDRAVARSYASVSLEGTTISNSALYFFDTVQNSVGGFQTLGLSFAVLAGQTGTLTMSLTSDAYVAPVPVPAALPLLGSALLGLFGLARRRRTAAA
jgi:hypothetical protein